MSGSPYQCSFCQHSFKSPSYCKRHEAFHAGHHGHVCPYCNKTFMYSSGLQVHLNSHTKARVFKCDICGKSFSGKGTLKRHLTDVHGVELPKKWCSEQFIALNINDMCTKLRISIIEVHVFI